jgi:hypothetical protein
VSPVTYELGFGIPEDDIIHVLYVGTATIVHFT